MILTAKTMNKRPISGILLLDKAQGMSSHTALSWAKRLLMSETLDSKKAGHTGTLDPMATGLLPLCFGEATKFAQFGLDADKGYVATLNLGEKTDTADQEGQIIARQNVANFSQDDLDRLAKQLLGEQTQIPPMYSALKKDGKKLYELARQGIEVERAARTIVIESLTLQKLSDTQIALNVICSKGTYIRTLGETIAENLGTLGHLSSLRRTHTGGFTVADAMTLDALEKLPLADRLARLLPIDVMVCHLPAVRLFVQEVSRLKLGQRLNIKDRLTTLSKDLTKSHALKVRLYLDDEFVGLGQVEISGRLQPLKMIHG